VRHAGIAMSIMYPESCLRLHKFRRVVAIMVMMAVPYTVFLVLSVVMFSSLSVSGL